MAALRLVAAYAQAEGGNKLESRDDFDVLGELALILNSVRDPAGEQLTPCDIGAQIAPSREIENHPDLGLTLVRIERMLIEPKPFGGQYVARRAGRYGWPRSVVGPNEIAADT
jgi:hypothetical protein